MGIMIQSLTQNLLSFDSHDEAALFHDAQRSGFFSLLVQIQNKKSQYSYRLSEMPRVLNAVDPKIDTWMSQAEFMRPDRRVVNLLRLGLLFIDIDTYKMSWAKEKKPEDLANSVIYHCQQEGIPQPSLIVYSGRGLQAKWLLEGTIPRQALPRWNACQRFLFERLASLGADPGAKDASRVLRLVNTVNSKSGQVCRVVYVNEQNRTPMRYGFEYLCESLLPAARWDIEKSRKIKNSADRHQFKLIDGEKKGNLRYFSGRQLAWDRLEDIRKLAEIRGGVVEGERMRHLFWRLNFLLLSGATNSSLMYHEAVALAKELDPSWSYQSQELITLYKKAKLYEAGEKIEFGGKEYPPLYTPKNDTLINLFNISDDEQLKLKTIISKKIASERLRKRNEVKRRAVGMIERKVYIESANTKKNMVIQLRSNGLSASSISKYLNIPIRTIYGYIKSANDCAKSDRITNGVASGFLCF